MTNNFKALGKKAAEQGANFTKPTVAGDFKPLDPGPCRLRFVGYAEVGKQKGTFQGKPTVKDKVWLTFEVSGPKHPPREFEGQKFPNLITIKENYGRSAKSNLIKLFNKMNHAGTAEHLVELLGDAFKGELFHRKYAKKGEDKAKPETWTGVVVELKPKGGEYQIQAPRYEVVNEDGPTGEYATLKVDEPLSPIRCFIWNMADKEQWDSLFIDGTYESETKEGEEPKPGKSKNVIQAAIMSAENFKGSPIHTLLLNNGQPLDIPDVEQMDGPEEEGEEGPAEAAGSPAAASVAVPEGEDADAALNAAMGA